MKRLILILEKDKRAFDRLRQAFGDAGVESAGKATGYRFPLAVALMVLGREKDY